MGGAMSLVLFGSTSGSVTLQEPAVAGTTVLDLPATSGTVLTSASQSIPKAALPTGSVLQVVSVTKTDAFTSSATGAFTDITGMSASITPTSASSRILVIVSSTLYSSSASWGSIATVYRNGSDIASSTSAGVLFYGDATGWAKCATTVLDSPASTSSLTYQLFLKSQNSGTNVGANRNSTRNSIVLMEIAG